MRKIIHIDMDCFFAAVEMRDNPAYQQVPLAVGGAADHRGVIATCNYRARQFGVHSAMSTARALKLCPSLVLVSGRMEAYRQVSRQIRQIFARYTPLIEPLSLDEAYLDVSQSRLFRGSATLIAEDIRRAIRAETGLTASAGVAPNKFLAKIASDLNKPDGLYVVVPDQVERFVAELPLEKIPGVGRVTAEKLLAMGLATSADVRAFPLEQLVACLGKFARVLWERCHGIDERAVETSRVRKSIGVERTLAEDLATLAQCEQVIDHLYPKLLERIDAAAATSRVSRLGVKLKFHDFQQTTVEHQQQRIERLAFSQLLQQAYERGGGRRVRLVGLQVGLDAPRSAQQLALDL